MAPMMGGMGFGTEVIYSFVIILASLMIYFATKELYELSSYKGIKYFRQAFLFFAIAYFFRSFIKFVMFNFGIGDMRYFQHGIFFGILTLIIFSYFSSMAIFYLVQSVLYKRINGKMVYVFHGLAIIISLSIALFMNPITLLLVNLFLLCFVFAAYYFAHKDSKNNSLSVIYGLLAFFWTVNFVDIIIPNFFQSFQLVIYIVSIAIFLVILYKVLKKVGAN